MAEAIGATATLLSIIGFSAQAFDGCVKGFILLSTAHKLGRDADILRSMLDWEQYRLEQWAEMVNLQDPAKADVLLDWDLVLKTLQHLEHLLNDASVLKKMYGLALTEEPTEAHAIDDGDEEVEKASSSRFRRLFASSEKYSSSAAAKVIQTKNSPIRKLWWAAVDRDNMQRLVADISHFVQRLHDSLHTSMQVQLQQKMQSLLQQTTDRYSDIPDLEYLRYLARQLRRRPVAVNSQADDVEEAIENELRYRLFYAIHKGKLCEISSLLDRGVNVDAEDHCGWSTLICAADYGQSDAFKYLLDRGADPRHGTIGGRIPLHFAAEGGHLDIMKLLLDRSATDMNSKDNQGQTAFFKAASQGHEEIVMLLLQQSNIDINAFSNDGFSPLLQAIYGKHDNITRRLVARPELDVNRPDTNFGQTPLWMAASGDTEIFKELLKRKDIEVDKPSRFGETALGRAARQSFNDALSLLLNAKANANARDASSETPLMHAAGEGNQTGLDLLFSVSETQIDLVDQNGRTALFLSAEAGHSKCVKSLLAKTPQLEIRDKRGRTALAIAAYNGHKIPAKMFIKAGADLNAQDEKGNTPLALAAINKQDVVVRLLLESGADADVADEDEETPYEKARDQRLEDVMKVFKEALTV